MEREDPDVLLKKFLAEIDDDDDDDDDDSGEQRGMLPLDTDTSRTTLSAAAASTGNIRFLLLACVVESRC